MRCLRVCGIRTSDTFSAQEAEDGQRKPVLKSDLNTQRFFIVAKKCKKLLGPLCDLQAVTGIGIITAGWAQIGSIDY